MAKDEWIQWNPKKLPKPGTIITALVEGFRSKNRQFVLLKRVEEDDVAFRTADDNSEFDEWNWQIVKYKIHTEAT
jgi:hypothetical protein